MSISRRNPPRPWHGCVRPDEPSDESEKVNVRSPAAVRLGGFARPSVLQSLNNLLDPSPVYLPRRFVSRPQSTPLPGQSSPVRREPTANERRRGSARADAEPPRAEPSRSGRRDAWASLKHDAPGPTRAPTPHPHRDPTPRPLFAHFQWQSPEPTPSPFPAALAPSTTPSQAQAQPARRRLSTAGLAPIRHRLRSSGTIEILAGPQRHLVLDVRDRGGGVLLISADGELISVFDRSGTSKDLLVLFEPDAVFRRDALPHAYEKLYGLALKFVEGIRAALPKIVFYSRTADLEAKHTLFSDSPPSFELTFPAPSLATIRIDRQRGLIRLSQPSQPGTDPLQNSHRSVRFPLDEARWPSLLPDEAALIKLALSRANTIDKVDEACSTYLAVISPAVAASLGQQSTLRPELRGRPPTVSRALSAIATAVASPPSASHHRKTLPIPPHFREPTSADRRCLPGLGWIERAPGDYGRFQVLYCDGEELVVDVVRLAVYSRGQWYEIGVDLPTRVKMRLALAKELIELF